MLILITLSCRAEKNGGKASSYIQRWKNFNVEDAVGYQQAVDPHYQICCSSTSRHHPSVGSARRCREPRISSSRPSLPRDVSHSEEPATPSVLAAI